MEISQFIPTGFAGNIFWAVLILIAGLWIKFSKDKSRSKSLPALFTIIGVFGTFFGITVGLSEFDVSQIEDSVSTLLEGLKFAFVTSVVGIAAAISLRVYNLLYAPADDSTDEAELVIEILRKNNELTEKVVKSISGEGDSSLTTQIGKLRNDYRDTTKELVDEFRAFADKQSENNMKALVDAIEQVIGDFNVKINEQFGENFKKLNEAVGKLLDWQENYYQQIEYMVDTINNTQKGVESSKQIIEDISKKYDETYKLTEDFQMVLTTLNEKNEILLNNIEQFAKLSDKASEAMPNIEKRIDDLTTGFATTINTNLQMIADAHKKQSDDASNMFKEFKTDLEDSFKGVGDNINKLSDSVEKEIKDTIQVTNSEIKEQITQTYNQTFERLEKLQAKMSEDLNSSIIKIDDQLSSMLTNSLNSMSSQLVTLSGQFVKDYQPLTNRLREVVNIASTIQPPQNQGQNPTNEINQDS